MFRIRECTDNFPNIWRVYISGSSSSGKTYFAKKLLDSSYINFKRIFYFHPDIHEDNPVSWDRTDIIFSAGLPSTDELLQIPENSCIILDDLFSEAKDSKSIDYLFRVLSGKRKLHVLIMTQRYFSSGTYALNIRNSSNIHVLLRNADEMSNLRVARSMGLKNEFNIALQETKNLIYPYILINRTNEARTNQVQIFIDIFSKNRKVVMSAGVFYLISARDFNLNYRKIDEITAIKKEEHPLKTSTKNVKHEKHESKLDFERRVKKIIRRYRKRSFL